MKLRSRTISVLSAVVTLASAGGLVALYAPSDARAAGETDSAVTQKWAGGNGELQQYQPDRSDMVDNADGSGHWDDFKDLEVTVSQTEGLLDQTVTVTAEGMAATEVPQSGRRNFLQIFQCWGDDPLEADFATKCQYGGHGWPETGGGASNVQGILADVPAVSRGTTDSDARKFQAVTGEESETTEVVLPGSGQTVSNRGVGAFFDRSSSNELPYVPISSNGTARINFIVQTAAAQPYLGCGDPAAAGERCWLVVVPRGIHSGTFEDGETRCTTNRTAANAFGGTPSRQMGSPIGPDCSFWHNRMVFPVDVADPFVSCPAGSAERRVVGTELLAEVMNSWQAALCAGEGGATFGVNTNSGNLSRNQLLTRQADMVAVSQPLTPDNIGGADPELLRTADLGYAPLANSALTIGFIADEQNGTVWEDIRLTPRMIAKMLTQSFRSDLAQRLGDDPATSIVGESYAVLRWNTVTQDEEWAALGNPTEFGTSDRAAWVVSGPRGDDAIRQLWEYVQADADAVAYLKGEPDPWGNVVNPYYLPAGHPDSVAGGYAVDLSREPVDAFPKADGSKYPDLATAKELYRDLQLDSLTYSPFSVDLVSNAARIAGADTRVTTEWDPNTINQGDWVTKGPMPPGQSGGRLVLGPTLAPSAELYGLPTASLSLPLGERTTTETVASAREFVAYGEQSMDRALEHASLDDEGVTRIDVTSLPTGAYPLTATIHAAVDLSQGRLGAPARADYAHLLEYAATKGNVISGERGGLPEGYAPLTAAQQQAALDLADRLLAPPAKDSGPGGNGPDDNGDDGAGSGGNDAPGDSAAPEDSAPGDTDATVPVPEGGDAPADGPPSDPGADGGPGGDPTTAQTEAAATEETAPLAASVALGGTLVAGLAGLAGAPFLMRRRDLTG